MCIYLHFITFSRNKKAKMTPKCIVVVMDLVIDNPNHPPTPSKSETEISMCHWVVEFIIANKSYSKCLLSYRQGK